ncbi:MAG TPA: galactose oxidase-like domain-containing protein, partial [Candidatus Caenarcaniphilales bacterium]
DYETGVIREIGTPVDMFCAGHAFLQDGRLLVAGGNKQYPGPTGPFQGLRDAFVFDPITEQWRRVATMAGGRWYPTLVTLPDGRIITFTGVRDNADEPFGADDLNNIPEIYAEPNGEPGNWTALPTRDIYPMYSHIFLMQDGRLFYSGGYQGFNTLSPRIYNYNNNTTQLVPGLRNINTRGEPISVMLPPVQDQRVLVAGGGDPTTNATDIINLKAANPAYAPAAPINYARMHGLGVVLPDRTVLICGGSQTPQDPATATLYSEIFNPVTNTWSIAAKNFWPRLYHTVALLLPDGRVVLSGGNPTGYQELRLEVYRPPYMFKPNRPTYGAAFQNTLAYGSIIGIPTPQSQQIQYVSLLKPMANTHTLETGQRLIDLQIVSRATPGYIHAQLANDRNLTPPGWYMLFIVDNRGVPSMGHWLRVY